MQTARLNDGKSTGLGRWLRISRQQGLRVEADEVNQAAIKIYFTTRGRSTDEREKTIAEPECAYGFWYPRGVDVLKISRTSRFAYRPLVGFGYRQALGPE
jgi:hypothetical protein